MEPYSESAASAFKLNHNDDWLRKRQGLALPALPPTTPEARQYYFSKIRDFSVQASTDNKKHVNYEAFAQEWNRTADGKERFYVTFEVLSAYAKGWEKTTNIRASEEMIPTQIEQVKASAAVFAATSQPFPSYMTSTPSQIQPSQGVVQLDDGAVPSSLSTALPTSSILNSTDHQAFFIQHPLSQQQSHSGGASQTLSPSLNVPKSSSPTLQSPTPQPSSISRENSTASQASRYVPFMSPKPLFQKVLVSEGQGGPPLKRRRVVADHLRKHKTVRSCRRCRKPECSGNNDILKCTVPCTIPCKNCLRTEGCRGVDNGKRCTFK